VTEFPLSIRDVAPSLFAVRLTGVTVAGFPDGMHTGGAWLCPDGTVWKGLDGRPWANATCHVPTHEAECLEAMAGAPLFPRNWWIEEANGRRFLVRRRAFPFPATQARVLLRPDQVETFIEGIHQLNERGWVVDDPLTLALDEDGTLFLVDLSQAHQVGEWADERMQIADYLDKAHFDERRTLYLEASHVIGTIRWQLSHPARELEHVYASYEANRPLEGPVFESAEVVFVSESAAGVRRWVVTRERLEPKVCQRCGLVWGFSRLHYQLGSAVAIPVPLSAATDAQVAMMGVRAV
jgi:hypothetical protein